MGSETAKNAYNVHFKVSGMAEEDMHVSGALSLYYVCVCSSQKAWFITAAVVLTSVLR